VSNEIDREQTQHDKSKTKKIACVEGCVEKWACAKSRHRLVFADQPFVCVAVDLLMRSSLSITNKATFPAEFVQFSWSCCLRASVGDSSELL
jgi:hypothetical protein